MAIMVSSYRLLPIFLLAAVAVFSVAKLSAFEETAEYSTRTLIDLTQEWQLFTPGEIPGSDWYAKTVLTDGWQAAPGVVAYVRNPGMFDSMEGVEWGTELPQTRDTFYLRTSFHLDQVPAADSRLILDFILKDGAVFYLNGQEVGRSAGMPRGVPITHETQSNVGPRMRMKTGFDLNQDLLVEGENVLAVSLHGYEDEENSIDRIIALRLTLVEGWSRRPELSLPRHVRVLWAQDPQTTAVVSWTTSKKGESHSVRFDTERRLGRTAAYANETAVELSGEFQVAAEDIRYGVLPGFYHHAVLTGLEPDTAYYFVVESDGEASREYWFRTAPADDQPIKVVFGGDSRIGGGTPYFHHDRRAINRRIASIVEENPEVIAFLHGGDVTQRAQWRYFGPWLTDHELTYTQDGRILPIVVARGNHDMDIGFEEVFYIPEVGGTRYYYTTTLTERITLITLNTEISLGGVQRRFLEEQLRKYRPQSRWLIMMYHKPAWPSVRGFQDGASRRRFWVPLFEQYRVDLALESHDHALKRTVPIMNNQIDPEGVVYIGDGGLGVPQRTPDPTRWYLQHGGMTAATHHVHLLEFHDDKLVGTAFDIGGRVVDQFELTPRGAPYAWEPALPAATTAARD
jgi:hypothetical protein